MQENMKSYFGKKDLLQSKTGTLSSRSTVSQTSRSTSSDKYLGYSLITNDGCVTTHRARVFAVATVTCITAVTLVVLIIVMTVTTDRTDSDTDSGSGCLSADNCPQESSCHDYVIIGGGLAGAYAAWKLNTNNNSVALFERSGRIGGNLYTQTFPFLSDIKLEVGLPYFMHKIHPRTEELIHQLGLDVRPYYGPDPENSIHYFTRGEGTSYRNLSSNVLKRYRLSQKEIDLVEQLKDGEKPVSSTPALLLFTKEMQSSTLYLSNGVFESRQSVRSTLLKGASIEGYNCMKDTSRQMDFIEEANARQFTELVNQMENQVDIHHDTLTLVEGMQSLPVTLVRKALNTSKNLHMDHKLQRVSDHGEYVQLTFQTGTSVGPTALHQEEVEFCARNVIFDLTPAQLREIDLPFSLPDDFNAIQPTRGLVIYLLFNGTLFQEAVTNGTLWLYTDTPLGDITITHAIRNVTIEATNESTTPAPNTEVTTGASEVNATRDGSLSNHTSPSLNIASSTTESHHDSTHKLTTSQSSLTGDHNVNNSTRNITDQSNVTTPLPDASENPAGPRYELHPVTVVQAVFTLQDGYFEYWRSLLQQGLPIFEEADRSITDTAFDRVKVHLEQVLHQPINDSATPLLSALVCDLTDDWPNGPISYTWKPGYDWSSQLTQLMHPKPTMNVYIVGQPYAPSYNSLGVEGHLSTVDNLLQYLETKDESSPASEN